MITYILFHIGLNVFFNYVSNFSKTLLQIILTGESIYYNTRRSLSHFTKYVVYIIDDSYSKIDRIIRSILELALVIYLINFDKLFKNLPKFIRKF